MLKQWILRSMCTMLGDLSCTLEIPTLLPFSIGDDVTTTLSQSRKAFLSIETFIIYPSSQAATPVSRSVRVTFGSSLSPWRWQRRQRQWRQKRHRQACSSQHQIGIWIWFDKLNQGSNTETAMLSQTTLNEVDKNSNNNEMIQQYLIFFTK